MSNQFGKLRQLMASASALVSRSGIAGQAGLQFGGDRNLYSALGYDLQISLAAYRDRYDRGGIAHRVVEAEPKATWRGNPVIVEDEDPDTTTQFEEMIIQFDKAIGLWKTMRKTDILSGIGHYGVMLIGAPGDMKEPLKTLKLEDIAYLMPWSEQDATILEYETNVEDPRFGQPILYNLLRTTNTTGAIGTAGIDPTSTQPRRVHWTRILHLAENTLDSLVFGQPRLEDVWNLFDDLEKVTGGGSEAYWQRVNPGMQLDVDKDTEMDEGDMNDLEEEVTQYIHNMRRFIRTRGTNLNVLSSSVSNFSNQSDSIIIQISGTKGIPKRILTGSEAAHLASSQDRTNWHEKIEDRREQYAEPDIIRPFINRMIDLGALPAVDEYSVRWPVMQDLNPVEQADVTDKLAGVNSKIGGTIITDAEIRDRILQLPPAEEVEDPEEEEIEAVEEPVIEDPALEDTDAEPRVSKKFKDVDTQPKSESWRDVHKVADAKRPAFAKAFNEAVLAAKRQVTVDEIRVALNRNDLEGLENIQIRVLNEFNQKMVATYPELLLDTLDAGGRVATAAAKTEDTLKLAQVVLSFQTKSPEAIKWASEHSASLVKSVSDTTRLAIQDAIVLGQTEGLTAATTARSIKNVIGLTPRDAASVMGAASEMSRKQLERFSNKLLRRRASNISRTETIAAANRGQQEFWRQAVSDGVLPLENAFQEWITTPDDRLCPICEPMQGQIRGLDATFETGDGDEVVGPPAHPSCRCAVGITTKTKDLPQAS